MYCLFCVILCIVCLCICVLKISHRGATQLQLTISYQLQSALNFYMNKILIRYGCSKIFYLFHRLREFIINLYIAILS